LVKDADSAQLVIDFESVEAETQVGAFVAPEVFEGLPSADRLAVRQAVQLFDFMATKPDALMAPVFQPLLGRIDQAAEGLILQRLTPLLPGSPVEREAFFPSIGNKYLGERARSLKRLLVTRSPIMPTGLLLFCIEYAIKDEPGAGGIFDAVRSSFSDLASSELPALLKTQYDFRNEYIAHEKREPLRSVEASRQALGTWTSLLVHLRSLGAPAAALG
jgi:type III restriction enzyme